MKWLLTGDIHRQDLDRFYYLPTDEDLGVIVLGDAGFDYLLDERDTSHKNALARKFPNITWYLVRGNHEARPADVEGMKRVFDSELNGWVMYHPDHMNIFYLLDGQEYQFGKYNAFVIGGAYSVDKYYRLMMGRTWFDNEQLDENERDIITKTIEEKWHYSFIFSHTCPYTWQPFDLFLSGLDQSTVDNTMEYWFDDIAKTANYDIWCFGHFHADRQQGEKGLMLYHRVITLDEAYERKI
jgi:3-oxoacid CoA-transferase subunit A